MPIEVIGDLPDPTPEKTIDPWIDILAFLKKIEENTRQIEINTQNQQ